MDVRVPPNPSLRALVEHMGKFHKNTRPPTVPRQISVDSWKRPLVAWVTGCEERTGDPSPFESPAHRVIYGGACTVA
jgi:hypothetical protein